LPVLVKVRTEVDALAAVLEEAKIKIKVVKPPVKFSRASKEMLVDILPQTMAFG